MTGESPFGTGTVARAFSNSWRERLAYFNFMFAMSSEGFLRMRIAEFPCLDQNLSP